VSHPGALIEYRIVPLDARTRNSKEVGENGPPSGPLESIRSADTTSDGRGCALRGASEARTNRTVAAPIMAAWGFNRCIMFPKKVRKYIVFWSSIQVVCRTFNTSCVRTYI
jgi:hypothetical protein